MKQKTSKLQIFFTMAVCILLFLAANPIEAKANELYFDQEGNLYYVTHEKKATGSTRYMTIGWIIKRYDMPIDVAGQQYVVVTKTNYKPDEVDPDNNKYIYSYFKSDKSEILNAIKSKYQEWYDILVNYGDYVYIDSVMTIVSGTQQKGWLYQGGRYEGEVYFTYEGIAGARNWASRESIKQNFDMMVKFPVINSPTGPSGKILKEELVSISSSVYGSFTNGANEYDISLGIPSGEEMYIKGMVDPAKYVLQCKKITGEYTVTVPVPVTYVLKWTDYYGVKREEKRVIYRNYQVKRQVVYYTFEGVEESLLEEIVLEGEVLGEKLHIPVDAEGQKNLTSGTVKYSSIYSHITGYNIKNGESVETIEVTSPNYLKPSIPSGDYSKVAEKLLGDVMIRSDKIVIDGKEVLSNAANNMNGATPKGLFYIEPVSISIDNIQIPKNVKNGEGYRITGQFIYVNEAGKTSTYEVRGLKPMTVHTPVVCSGTVRSDKTLNQAVEPQSNDVVLGESLRISFNDFGMHRSIMGYGLNSYSRFVGRRQILCPFAVIYEGVRYGKGSWITLSSFNAELIVCDDNQEGEYTILMRNVAYNSGEDIRDDLMQESGNMDLSSYGAFTSKTVRIIGKLHELTVKNGENILAADSLPISSDITDGTEKGKLNYIISISTVGDIWEKDYLEVDYSYYIENNYGDIIPVEVFKVESRDQLQGDKLEPFVDKEMWNRELCQLNGNKGVWTSEYVLPEEYIVVPKGIGFEQVVQAIEEGTVSQLIINNGSLLIAAEFTRYKDGVPYISYINEKNSENGYCNMWLYEGGREEIPYGAIIRTGLAGSDYYDYQVSGTH